MNSSCAKCGTALSDTFVEKEEQIYCPDCGSGGSGSSSNTSSYSSSSSSGDYGICPSCKNPVTGRKIAVLGKSFHESCFMCSSTSLLLF